MGLDPDFVKEWSVRARAETYFDVPVNKMNRDELLALVGWLVENFVPKTE